ncbi:MAG: NRDE family protein [Thiolinea sp.]
MCFALLALQQHPHYPFILAANRDEFFDRPAIPLGVWPSNPALVGGIDQSSQGSWLALNQNNLKFALVTNVRQGSPQPAEHSRGLLVSEFVASSDSISRDLQQIEQTKNHYAGFNLIAGYLPNELYYLSNKNSNEQQLLNNDFYGLSNASLNTSWPKLERGLSSFKQLVTSSQSYHQPLLVDQLFELLADKTKSEQNSLPNTGIGLEKELWLSPIFIEPGFMNYGTRCSTLILMDINKQVFCYERTYYSDSRTLNSEYCFYSS